MASEDPKFLFLKLPREMRDMVYRELLVGDPSRLIRLAATTNSIREEIYDTITRLFLRAHGHLYSKPRIGTLAALGFKDKEIVAIVGGAGNLSRVSDWYPSRPGLAWCREDGFYTHNFSRIDLAIIQGSQILVEFYAKSLHIRTKLIITAYRFNKEAIAALLLKAALKAGNEKSQDAFSRYISKDTGDNSSPQITDDTSHGARAAYTASIDPTPEFLLSFFTTRPFDAWSVIVSSMPNDCCHEPYSIRVGEQEEKVTTARLLLYITMTTDTDFARKTWFNLPKCCCLRGLALLYEVGIWIFDSDLPEIDFPGLLEMYPNLLIMLDALAERLHEEATPDKFPARLLLLIQSLKIEKLSLDIQGCRKLLQKWPVYMGRAGFPGKPYEGSSNIDGLL